VKQKVGALTLATLNNGAAEVVTYKECVDRMRSVEAQPSPDLPIAVSHLSRAEGRFAMFVCMNEAPVLSVYACWQEDVSTDAWQLAERLYKEFVEKAMCAGNPKWQPRIAPSVPWCAVTVLRGFDTVPAKIADRIEAFVKGAVWREVENED
jgi:hypothetical protein